MDHSVNQGRSGRTMALIVLLVGAFLPPLDFFIVNLALPAIQHGLNASGAQLQLIISFYGSAYAVFLITGGRLGDAFGRKRMFMIGLAGFILASALCGLSPTVVALISARILQGLTAAIMAPQVLASIRNLYPESEQARVIGFYGSVFGLSAVAGQLLGGMLITWRPFHLDWQSIFLINIPIGLIAFLGAAKFLPETKPTHQGKFDFGGVLLLSLLLGCVIYPLTRGREEGWPHWTYISFATSLPILVLFILAEGKIIRRGGEPLVDLRLFSNSAFVIGLVMAFLFYCLSIFFLAFGVYLQNGLGWSPLASGVAITPYTLGFLAASLCSAALFSRIGNRILDVGFGMIALGCSLMAFQLFFGHGVGPTFCLGLIVAGTGQGLLQPSTVRIVLTEVEPQKAGLAAGVVTSILQIGAAFGVAAIGSVFFGVLGHRRSPDAYGQAFAVALMVVAVAQVLGILLGSVLNKAHRTRARTETALSES